jgi:crossover junction endodeoxyribonuclease RusA
MEFHVIGLPAPQGSKKFWGFSDDGQAILADSCVRTKPWQETVKWAAVTAKNRQRWSLIRGPVAIEITFTMYKPKSAPRRRKTYPAVAPDLDKLIRAVWDTLRLKGGIGLIEDDSCIVESLARKVYPGEHPDALDVPGAVIRLWPMAVWTGYAQHPNLQQQDLLIG